MYWKDKLVEQLPIVEVSADRNCRQKASEIKFESLIKNIRNRNKIGDKSVFLAAYLLMLGKSTYQDNVMAGLPMIVSSEYNEQYTSLLPIIMEIDNKENISDFLHNVQCEYNRIQENKQIDIDSEYNEITLQFLGKNIFTYQEVHEESMNSDWKERVKKACLLWKTDIWLNVEKRKNNLQITMFYNMNLFRTEKISSLLEHYCLILSEVLNKRDITLGKITLATEQEERTITKIFNKEIKDNLDKKTIIEVFEEQVKLHYNKYALNYLDERLTYGQLNERANQVAAFLISGGIQSNEFVAIIAEKSIEMIVGIFGILKSGAAYVPIDPSYPTKRISYILEDCKARMILYYLNHYDDTMFCSTEEYLKNQKDVLAIDLYKNSKIEEKTKCDIKSSLQPNDLAYVIYTSGTTGKPKGVMIEQHSVVNLVEAYQEVYDMNSDDVLLQFASFAFDQSVWDIFGILLLGGTLCLTAEKMYLQREKFIQYLNKNRVSIAALTPAFIAEFEPQDFSTFRALESGGAEFKDDMMLRWLQYMRIFNTYGPTEATVNAITYECKKENCVEKIPIGKPIANVQAYILNQDVLCGIDMPGELCIAGEGVSRGYLNREELTERKFVHNPFGKGKLYRTGDLAKWDQDGNICYLGRIDKQEKIRGYRIELGEIESVFRKISSVKECVVIVREDNFNNKELYAYYEAEVKIEIECIVKELRKYLPDYMIPSYIMQIDKIPLNLNGKLDVRKLPMNIDKQNSYVPPKSKKEKMLCEIFQDVLQIEQVGITDNFFYLGGHSLRAARAVNRIQKELQIEFTPNALFFYPTVQKMITYIEKSKSLFKEIPVIGRKEYYKISAPQDRLYILDQMYPGGTAYNLPVSLEFHGRIDFNKLKEAVAKLVRRHEAFRTYFDIIDDKVVQRICDDVDVNIDYNEEYCYSDRDKLNVLKKFVKPFSLNQPPLLRVGLTKINEMEYLLLLDMHHIISDGMSFNVLYDDLSKLYNGEELSELRVQYKDYSEWMNGRDLIGQEKFWLNQYDGKISALNFPLDYPRPPMQSFDGDRVSFTMKKGIRNRVKKLAKEMRVTEYMICLSAVMILLGKYSNQEDVIVGSLVSGRTHEDTINMIGMFVNTIALRGKPEKQKKYKTFLNEIRELCLNAYENQEYSIEELVQKLNIKRDVSRRPLFDVMVVMQNNEDTKMILDGLVGHEVELDTESKFDLNIDINLKDEYQLLLSYCASLFKRATVVNIAKRLEYVLEQIMDNPDCKIEEIKILADSEKRDIYNRIADRTYQILDVYDLDDKKNKKFTLLKRLIYGNNLKPYIIRDGDLCPCGVYGEICLYTGKEIENKILNIGEEIFCSQDGLWHTELVARWNNELNIEVIGEMCDLIQIEGYVINLREVAYMIENIIHVNNVEVLVNGNLLLAMIESDEKNTKQQVRNVLLKEMPEYMLPKRIILLDSIPYDKKGNVDIEKVIRESDTDEIDNGIENNQIDEQVIQMIKEVLGIQKVGLQDSFFELGGDSIKAIRLVSRLKSRGYFCTVENIMSEKNIMTLAKIISEKQKTSLGDGKLFFTPAIKTFFQDRRKNTEHESCWLALESNFFDIDALQKAFSHLINHYDMLRCGYKQGNMYINADIEKNDKISRMCIPDNVDEEGFIQSEIRKIQKKVILSKGKVFFVEVLHGKKKEILLLALHWLVADWRSRKIFLNQLYDLYSYYLHGGQNKSMEYTLQYKQWSEKVRLYVNSLDVEEKLQYWKRELGLFPCGTASEDNARKNKVLISIQHNNVKLIEKVCDFVHLSMKEVLMSVIVKLYFLKNPQDKMLLWVYEEGRNSIDILQGLVSESVGYFAYIYPNCFNRDNEIEKILMQIRKKKDFIDDNGFSYSVLQSEGKLQNESEQGRIIFQFDNNPLTNELSEWKMFDNTVWDCIYDNDDTVYIRANRVNDTVQIVVENGAFGMGEQILETFEQDFLNSIEDMVSVCENLTDFNKTATDFKLEGVSDEEFEKILDALDELL